MHIYRWDLDKTYLDTDIGSVRGLLKAAVQTAAEKRNIPGSATLLRSLQAFDDHSSVFVLSGSPLQMRPVIEAKLAMDGIQVEQLVLKDNLGNIRRGRLRAVRDQLGYKLPRLLKARAADARVHTETLFGDDSEVDALIYTAYAAAIEGSLSREGLRGILERGRLYEDDFTMAMTAFDRLPKGSRVQDIFIHVEKGVPLDNFDLMAGRVTPVFSWFQAALCLWARERLSPQDVAKVTAACREDDNLNEFEIAGLVQDAVRRNLIQADAVMDLLKLPPLRHLESPVSRAISRLGSLRDPVTKRTVPDWYGFLGCH